MCVNFYFVPGSGEQSRSHFCLLELTACWGRHWYVCSYSSGKCCEGEVQLASKESYRGLDLVWKIWESFPEEMTLELRPEG